VPAGNERITPTVADISSDKQLLCYATIGQLAQIHRHWGVTQEKIALGAGFGTTGRNAGAALAAALRNGLNAQHLQKLDEILGALDPDLDGPGGLSSLALRLSAEQRDRVRDSLVAHVPPSWARKILEYPSPDEIGVLIQASALLAAFMAVDKMNAPGRGSRGATRGGSSIWDRYGKEMESLVRRLILISVAPPSSKNYDAQILLGSLASYAFEPMRQQLETELRSSPMGFRVWRAITKLVKLSGSGEHADALRAWVRQLIRDSEEMRKRSLYSGRSLDLELAITVPAAWSPPRDDWAGEALLKRATNPEATIRERGTAAMGLWQRALLEDGPGLEQTEEQLRALITEFREPESRPDAAAGLRWVAATLELVIENRVAVCNEWPEVDEPWFRHVQEAAEELDNHPIPGHLLPGTKTLFRHMILQNAGVYRRQAIETLVTGGWNEPVARALGVLLDKEQDEAWLRVRAEFALGFMQRPDPSAETDLTRACEHAFSNLRLGEIADDMDLPRSRVTEMHASLFAVGDCFGVAGAEERAASARERLRDVLTELAGAEGARALILRRAVRAAAYVLIFTAQPRDGGEKDLSQVLLEQLSHHPDEVTARLSRWALRFRFGPGGEIRPLLAAG
jgi:hypothetical protein